MGANKIVCAGLILLFCGIAFADVDIYCPNCKEHLYVYEGDIVAMEVVYAHKAKPASEKIPKPNEADDMNCPLCKAPINGYQYQAYKEGRKLPVIMTALGVTVLTKEDGSYKWVPWPIECKVE